MAAPEPDNRSPTRKALDERIANEPQLARPDRPPQAVPSPLEAHLSRMRPPNGSDPERDRLRDQIQDRIARMQQGEVIELDEESLPTFFDQIAAKADADLDAEQRLARLRSEVQERIASLERGEGIVVEGEVGLRKLFDEIEAEVDAEMRPDTMK